MKPTEREFFERLEEINEKPSMIIAYMACAMSGFIMGFIIGYFVGWL